MFLELPGLGGCVPRTKFSPFRVFGSVGGGVTFGVPSGVSGRSGRYSGIRDQGSNEICNGLITMAVPKKGGLLSSRFECELQESVAVVLGAHVSSVVVVFACAAVGVRPRPAHPCGCVAKAERAYVWCGLHRCRVVICGTGRRCSRSPSLLVLVEVRFPHNCVVLVSGCCGVALWVELCLEALVVVWCVALSAYVVGAVSDGESLPVGHESFQAVGAVV
ncbi:hypothetical protein Taro_044420 [Colocasia esculenta]|uniref:Uncharacterized protein n=1 Tax=Colocasia esculenta TaxID=4460 RepID=A0A843WJ41_COLES|nr:hypothetical protein [Colocasia esculenta]